MFLLLLSLPYPAPFSRSMSTVSHTHYTPSQAQVFKFQKLSNSLISPVERRSVNFSALSRTIFQCVRIAGRVLPGNLPKIHSQDLPSFFHASKRCSSHSVHRPCLASLESPLSLLKSGTPSLKSSSSPLIDGSTSAVGGAPTSMKQWLLLQFKNDRPLYGIAF
jgi:hypothetical protein